MDRKRFFNNGILMTLVNLALRTTALLFSVYVASMVGAEGVGLNTLINTVYAFALTFATSGISLTVTRLVAENIGLNKESHIGRTIRGAVIYSLLFSGVATLVLSLFSGVISSVIILDARAVLPLGILSISLIPASLTAVISGYFIGVGRVLPNAVIQVAGQILRIIITVILLSSMAGEGVESAMYALAVGISITELAVFVISFVVFVVDRLIHRIRGEGGADFRPVVGTALPLGISAYIRSLLLSFEHALIPRRLVLFGASREEALSLFGIVHGMALPMILYPMSPLTSFAGLLVPEFAEAEARRSSSRASRIANLALSRTLIYASLAGVLLFFFSEELGYAVYSSYEAGNYIAILAPVVPLMYLDHVTDSILKGIGEHVYSMWVNIADSALSVLLVFFLIPHLGILGYAVVIIVMELFNFILSFIRLGRRVSISVDLIRFLLIPSGSALVAALLTSLLFVATGSLSSLSALAARLVFAVCLFIPFYLVIARIYDAIQGARKSTSSEKSRV